jgi:hypothetical protein
MGLAAGYFASVSFAWQMAVSWQHELDRRRG